MAFGSIAKLSQGSHLPKTGRGVESPQCSGDGIIDRIKKTGYVSQFFVTIPFMKNPVLSYIKEVRNELFKVSWPTKKETVRLTTIVVVVSVVVAAYLGALDFVFSLVLKLILK